MYFIHTYDTSERDADGKPRSISDFEVEKWHQVEPYFDQLKVEGAALCKVMLSPRGILHAIVRELNISEGKGLLTHADHMPSAWQDNEFDTLLSPGNYSTVGVSIEGEWENAKQDVAELYHLWHARAAAEQRVKQAFDPEQGCVHGEEMGLDELLADHPNGVGMQRELDLIVATSALLERATWGVERDEAAARGLPELPA